MVTATAERSINPTVFLLAVQRRQAQLLSSSTLEHRRRSADTYRTYIGRGPAHVGEASFASTMVESTFNFAAAVARGAAKEWDPSHVVWLLLLQSFTAIQFPPSRSSTRRAMPIPSRSPLPSSLYVGCLITVPNPRGVRRGMVISATTGTLASHSASLTRGQSSPRRSPGCTHGVCCASSATSTTSRK